MLYFFFFNDTATTEIYTLSLHDALPISLRRATPPLSPVPARSELGDAVWVEPDRKSTRLNSSHMSISYAVFCLKKKKKQKNSYPSRSPKTSGESPPPSNDRPSDCTSSPA